MADGQDLVVNSGASMDPLKSLAIAAEPFFRTGKPVAPHKWFLPGNAIRQGPPCRRSCLSDVHRSNEKLLVHGKYWNSHVCRILVIVLDLSVKYWHSSVH